MMFENPFPSISPQTTLQNRRRADTVLRWLRSCACCGTAMPPIDLFCDACRARTLAHINEGPHLRVSGYAGETYSLLTWTPKTAYEVAALVHGLKGGRHPRAALEWVERFSFERAKLGATKNPVFFAPPAKGNRRDHSWLLAEIFAEVWGSHAYRVFDLKAPQMQHSQKTKSAWDRWALEFDLSDDASEIDLPRGSTLVFVDDVITTGATARAAYIALKKPQRFEVWTLADRPKLAASLGV